MESTDDFADKEGDWSDADDNVDDGAVEGFDDEHWDCDGSKGTANADTPGIAVESSGTLQNIASAVSASAGPASAEAEAVSSEKCAVDKDDASAEDTAKDPETSGKWGIGSTLTAFAGALQQDVKEISESMKNAIQHVKEEFQGSPESFHGLEPARPEGLVALDRSPFDDDEFQNGLEAIDEQVDQLASAAGKALGSFWTGIGGALNSGMQAASNIAGQIETAAVQAANRVSETTKEHVPWGANGFRTSAGGTLVLPPGGPVDDEWQVVDLLGSPSTSVAASFEQLFKLYRGPRFVDDLEAIGNEAARSCNRIRAILPDDKRDELDAIVAHTSAFINLMATVPPTSDSHSAAKALTQDTPPSSAPGSAAGAAAKGGPSEALVTMCTAAVSRAASMSAAVSLASHESAWEGLCRLRAEGLKLLAEFTALSMQHVAFLAMCLEGGDAEAAQLEFSPDGKNKGAVVRQVLLQVLSDAEAIYVAFHSALAAATSSEEFAALAAADARVAASAEAREGDGGDSEEGSGSGVLSRAAQAPVQPGQRDLAAVAKELERGLDVGVSAAMDRILQASKHLLYPICAPAAEQLRAQDSIFVGEAAGAAGDTLESGDDGDVVYSSTTAAASGTAPAKSQGVSADEVTVEEGSKPPVEGNELAAEDAHEAPEKEVDPHVAAGLECS